MAGRRTGVQEGLSGRARDDALGKKTFFLTEKGKAGSEAGRSRREGPLIRKKGHV